MEECQNDASLVMYTEDINEELLENHYMETELREIKTIYIGTESEAGKRFQRSGPYRRQYFGRQRSGFWRQSMFDRPRLGDGKNTMNYIAYSDRSCSATSQISMIYRLLVG